MRMAPQRQLTDEERKWILANFPDTVADKDVAEYLSCHVHTARKILVSLNLLKARTDKYQYKPSLSARRRTRKCLICRREKRLPKNQFICSKCRNLQREKGLL